MGTLNIQLLYRIPNLSPFTSLHCAIINPQWLELPISRTNFYGPNDVRAIEVRLLIDSGYEHDIRTYATYVRKCKFTFNATYPDLNLQLCCRVAPRSFPWVGLYVKMYN